MAAVASSSWIDGGATDISRISINKMDGSGGGDNGKIKSRKAKLEAELKLLEWHKMANEAALKAALLQTKSIKETAISPAKSTASFAQDDEKWIRKVIDEEQVKPLEVSRDFVLEYEKREKANAERLSTQVERHIGTLKKLRERLENRQEVKQRSEEYRSWQRTFAPKKNAVYSGKTLDEAEAELANRKSQNTRDPRKQQQTQSQTGPSAPPSQDKPELSAVLDSLNKLAELENRITHLEKDNQYDYLVGKENRGRKPNPQEEMFKKKRIPVPAQGVRAPQAPMGVKYQMQQKPSPRKQMVSQRSNAMGGGGCVGGYSAPPGQGQYTGHGAVGSSSSSMGRGSGVAAVKARRGIAEGQTQRSGQGPGQGGTFLTGMDYADDELSDVELARQARRRQQALASDGAKNLRGRVQARKQRAKELSTGARKHEAALREMQNRKSNQSFGHRTDQSMHSTNTSKYTGGTSYHPSSVTAPTRGAASGLKTKNKYLQEFEKVKAGYAQRTQAKKLGTKFPGGASSMPAARQGQGPGGYGGRQGQRIPATQVSGTVTRRAIVPTNRQQGGGGSVNTYGGSMRGGGGGGQGNSMVGGVSGIRALQQGRKLQR